MKFEYKGSKLLLIKTNLFEVNGLGSLGFENFSSN